MNTGITRQNVRESAGACLAGFPAMVAFVVLFIWAMHEMGPHLMDFLSNVGFLRRMMELAFGITISGEMSSNILHSIPWLHPVVLVIAWGILIATATRQTAGDVESGIAELILTLPVSRIRILVSGVVCLVLVADGLSLAPMVGLLVGNLLVPPPEPVAWSRFGIVMVNFLALNLAVAALATLAGSGLLRRGRAVALTGGWMMGGLAMNFLEPFLPAVHQIRWIHLLNWYRPAEIVRSGEWPVVPIAVLCSVAVVSWTVSVMVWNRRDIPAA